LLELYKLKNSKFFVNYYIHLMFYDYKYNRNLLLLIYGNNNYDLKDKFNCFKFIRSS